MKKIPVHIITGFLGSGKTTFLNHFIRERLPERLFVIENECGQTNVDGALVMDGVEEVVELSAGCLCCSLADGLLDILAEAGKRQHQYDRLVIETTGIADPSSIIQVFLDNPQVEQVFALEQVICLADAGLVEEWLTEAEEALRQVALADAILINKTDTVAPPELARVKAALGNINPHAAVFAGQQGKFDVDQILATGTTKPVWVEAATEAKPDDHHHHHHHDHDHHHHDHNHDHDHSNGHHHHQHEAGPSNSHQITTFTLTFPHPLDLDSLSLDLNRIVRLYRSQVYRVKGYIAVPDYPNRVILQSARSAFIVTDGTPWQGDDKRVGKLVFIGRGLQRKAFEKMFNKHLAPARVAVQAKASA